MDRLLAAADDARIEAAIIRDMESLYRPLKKPITIRLDADVLEWFKRGGRHYQTRMNEVLRMFMIIAGPRGLGRQVQRGGA
jgi:uncharacterized protein (DUF4415 family)